MATLSTEYVETQYTKSASRGWKVLCPSCGGNDLWYTPENNRAYCFECSANYSIGEQKNKEDIPVFDVDKIRSFYTSVASEYHSLIDKDHREYLHSRGVDDSAIDNFQIGYCPAGHLLQYRSDIARYSGIVSRDATSWLSNRIVFPYIAESVVTDMRGRSMSGEDPKYKSAFHRSYSRGAIFPYNYDRASERSRDTKRVIITEGEIKAILADVHGYAAIALPGMTSWRRNTIFPSDVDIITVFDNSAKFSDRIRVDKAIAKITRYVPNLYVALLPLLGESKMDIDSYLLHKRGGAQRFDRIINGALEYKDYVKLRRF